MPFVYTEETMAIPPDSEGTKKIILAVADRIINNTSHTFLNKKTNSETDASIGLTSDFELKSGFLDWKYWNGVNHLAFDVLAKDLVDNRYRDYSQKHYQFVFDHLPFFKSLFDAEVDRCNFHQYFRMDRLDDCGAMGGGLVKAHQYNPDERYQQRINETAQYMTEKQDRLEDGTFCRNRFGYTSLWADDLFMGLAFLINHYATTKEERYLDDCILQVKNFHKHLWSDQWEIFHHSKIIQEGLLSAAFWGRANGWVAMAQAMLLDVVPENHAERNTLIALLKKQIVGLSRYQGKNGLWHQLLNKTESFEESSSTSMFTFAIAKAVNKGWIPDIYVSIATAAWNGLKECVDSDGNLDKVSLGFNIKQDLPFYYNQPIEKGGDHGLGAFLLCANEIRKLKPFRDCVWC